MSLKEGQSVADAMNFEHGSDVFDNGDSYIGKLKDGVRNGFGHYTWANGNYYIGEFKDGLKHGYGFWSKSKDTNSNQYRGEFLNDKKCGYGVFRWTSGNQYKGNYKNDEREGYGEMYWADGSIYKGSWHNGIQHGLGTMIFPDGTFIKGYFKNNVFLNSSEIPDQIQNRSQEREIEAHIYNLPTIRKSGHKSVIEAKEVPILTRIQKHCISPRIVSSKLKDYRSKIATTRRSVEQYTPKNNTFYGSQNVSKLNSSIPNKNRNTYN
jgi:hypothetical protein